MLSEQQARHFAAFARALEGLRFELERAPTRAPERQFSGAFPHDLNALMQDFSEAVKQLAEITTGRLAEVAADDHADEASMHRVAGQWLATMTRLRGLEQAARWLPAAGQESTARELLVKGFSDTLKQIRTWLGEVACAAADPLEAARKRGLSTTGAIELPLTLNLTGSAAFDQLARWCDTRAAEASAIAEFDDELHDALDKPSGIGFWGMAAAIALGLCWGS